MSRSYIRTIATLSFAVVAVASQAAVYVQTIPTFTDTSGGDSMTTMLAKFNPSWGTLLAVTIGYTNTASGSNTVTNIDVAPGTYNNSVHSDSTISVYEDSLTYGITDMRNADASANGFLLNPGSSDTESAADSISTSISSSWSGVLSAYSGAGNVIVTQSSFGIASGTGDHQVQNAGSEFAQSYGLLTYEYRPAVPAPAAAGTMLIGMIGGFVRRKRSA